ncbi:MAG TPA: formyltransferase family protein, partial [Tissierellaceae bacterium]
MLNICVLASGGGSNLQAIIDNCENSNINGQVKLVVSNKKDAYALQRAEKYNIKNIYLNPKDFESIDIYNEEILKICKDLKIDLIVLAGYLKILSG